MSSVVSDFRRAPEMQSLASRARRLDVGHFLSVEPAPIDYLFGSFALVAGTTGVIFAPGGAGKSMVALTLAASLAVAGAGGEAYDPLGVSPLAPKDREGWRVIYYCTEDPDELIHARLRRIANPMNPEQRRALAESLEIRTLHGVLPRVLATDPADAAAIEAECKGARLVVIDTLTRVHDADENDNVKMACVVGALEKIARGTGAAVVVLHHVGKGYVADGTAGQQQAARGASAITDNMRWALAVARADSETLRIAEAKHNYGRGAEPFGARWGAGMIWRCALPDIAPSRAGLNRKKELRRGV